MRIRPAGVGTLLGHERCVSAGCNTEGGLTSLPEGLRGFGLPCTKVLSVSELLTVLGLFPPISGFIPEVKEPLFPEHKGRRGRSDVKNCHRGVAHGGSCSVMSRGCTHRERYTARIYHPGVYREAYSRAPLSSRHTREALFSP